MVMRTVQWKFMSKSLASMFEAPSSNPGKEAWWEIRRKRKDYFTNYTHGENVI